MDFFIQHRDRLIRSMQVNLGRIRQAVGWERDQLGELVGISEDALAALETGEDLMNATQYVALCATLDRKILPDENLTFSVLSLLSEVFQSCCPDDEHGARKSSLCMRDGLFDDFSFLDKWFLSFPMAEYSMESANAYTVALDESLSVLARDFMVFINYDSLLLPTAASFLEHFSKYLADYRKKIIVPLRAIQIIHSSMFFSGNNEGRNAQKAMTLLSRMQSQNTLDIRGERGDDVINDIFLSVFARHRGLYKLMLITQDVNLAGDILSLNQTRSTRGNPVMVCRINESGLLELFEGADFRPLSDARFNEPSNEREQEEERTSEKTSNTIGWDYI